MNKLFAFIKKDFLEEISYRFNFFLSLAGMLLSVFMFYFIGKTFSGTMSPTLQRYGGDYFPYVLIGIAVSNFVTFGLSALSQQVRSAQVVGTLEALMGTPTSIYTILVGNSLWSFFTALGRSEVSHRQWRYCIRCIRASIVNHLERILQLSIYVDRHIFTRGMEPFDCLGIKWTRPFIKEMRRLYITGEIVAHDNNLSRRRTQQIDKIEDIGVDLVNNLVHCIGPKKTGEIRYMPGRADAQS